MFDWTTYRNLACLQINVDTISFSKRQFALIHSLIQPTLWLVSHAHMLNSLTHRSPSPSNPQEEFLLEILKRPYRILYDNTTSPKIEREKNPLTNWKSNLIYAHMKNKSFKFHLYLKIANILCERFALIWKTSVKLLFVTKSSKHLAGTRWRCVSSNWIYSLVKNKSAKLSFASKK